MPNKIPEKMKMKEAMSRNQDMLAKTRTELSITRTKLAFHNSYMSLNRTHLSYLRTIVTLIGSGATLFKALPALGVSTTFSTVLSIFLFLCAFYFIYKDATIYPKMKKELKEMEAITKELSVKTRDEVYDLDAE